MLKPRRDRRVQDHSARQALSDERARKVLTLWDKGLTDTAFLAERTGLSRKHIQRILVRGSGRET